MSVLRVPCPNCGTLLNVSDRFAGRTGRCSGCRRPFTVPAVVSPGRGRLWLGFGAFALVVTATVAIVLAVYLPNGDGSRSAGGSPGLPPDPTPVAGTKRALLIGVNEYDRDSDLRNLQFPVRDVEELGAVLARHGYEVTLLATGRAAPTRDAIRAAFAAAKAQCAADDTLVVAFAGHGTQPADTFFFCPADARLGDPTTLVSIDDVFADMKECKGRIKLLLADACRDKPPPLSRGPAVETLASKTRPRKHLPSPPSNVTAFYSCSEDEQAFEHPALGHGVFFHFVIKGLKGDADFNQAGEVTVPKLQEYVQKEVVSFVERQIGRRQRPALETKMNVNAPIVAFAKAATPPPAPPPESKGFDYEENFRYVDAGALPAGWVGGEFAVARAADGTPYLKLKRTAGRHYVHVPRRADLGQAFALECDFALGATQALEIAFAADGTPGVSLLVRGDGTMLFPGARPARPEKFNVGGRNFIRLWRIGDKFRAAANDEGSGADCVFDAELPRRLTGVSLGYVAAGANEMAILNAAPAFGAAGGPAQPWGPAVAWPNPPRDPPAGSSDPGIYSLRVGKLPDQPMSAAPRTVRANKVGHDFSRLAELPRGWDAKGFNVVRDEGGRMAMFVTSNRPTEFTATLTPEGMGDGLNGDYFLEFEFAVGHDGLKIELDGIGTAGKVDGATGDEASRVQRLFVQRVAGNYTVVRDGKDATRQEFGNGTQPPMREVRVTMKGGRDTRSAARLYAVRGGELEPQPGRRELVAQPAKPRGLQIDFAKGDANRIDDWEEIRSSGKPAVIETGGRRWLGLRDRGFALLGLPRVDVAGDFVAEFDFTINRGAIFGVRLVRVERDAANDRFFELKFDGEGNYAVIDSLPKVATRPVQGALRTDRMTANALRLTRAGDAIAVDLNGTSYPPVKDYPRVPFAVVQVMMFEKVTAPAWPVGVTRVNVTPK